MTTRPAFELAGVHLVEQGTVVLHDLDWTAQTDERWVVLGSERVGQDLDPAGSSPSRWGRRAAR